MGWNVGDGGRGGGESLSWGGSDSDFFFRVLCLETVRALAGTLLPRLPTLPLQRTVTRRTRPPWPSCSSSVSSTESLSLSDRTGVPPGLANPDVAGAVAALASSSTKRRCVSA